MEKNELQMDIKYSSDNILISSGYIVIDSSVDLYLFAFKIQSVNILICIVEFKFNYMPLFTVKIG